MERCPVSVSGRPPLPQSQIDSLSMAVPLGITLIAAIFSLMGIVAIAAGLYLFFVVLLGSNALRLVAPLTALLPELKDPIERITLKLSSADSGPFQALIVALMAFGLATALFSVGSGLSNLKPWTRTLVMVFTVIAMANGLARLSDRSATGSIPGAIAVGVSLLILLYLSSPEIVALFESEEE